MKFFNFITQSLLKIAIVLIFLELFLSVSLFCQGRVFLCPGFKFGYAFGENDGFIYGLELSMVYHSDESIGRSIYGLVISIDKLKELNKFHIGFERTIGNDQTNFLNGLGFEIGPTLVWSDDEKYFGLSVCAYHGFIFYPYFTFNFINKDVSFQEIGGYLKFPIMMTGKPIRFGG